MDTLSIGVLPNRRSLELALCLLLSACNSSASPQNRVDSDHQRHQASRSVSYGSKSANSLGLPYEAQIYSQLYTGGQPSARVLDNAKKAGVTLVINLRTDAEPGHADEAELVRARGMRYVSIPVDGKADLTAETVSRLDQAISALGEDERALIHCATSNRVGALIALRAFLIEHQPEAQALALGKRAGLKSLKVPTRRVMQAYCASQRAQEPPCS